MIVWVRNPNWDQSTDTIRKPLVDKITLKIITNPDDNDKRCRPVTVDLDADGGVQAAFQTSHRPTRT